MLDSSVCVGRSDVIDAARCAQIFENLWKYIVDPTFCFCMNTIKKYLRDYSKKLRAFFAVWSYSCHLLEIEIINKCDYLCTME